MDQLNCQHQLSDGLNVCRTLDQRCRQTYCPICARQFRIWFIGELLRIIDELKGAPVHIMTILLELAPHDQIDRLNLKTHDAALRKRLSRNGLNGATIIGGYENVYRARTRTWVLHINVVIIGGTIEAIERFAATFSNSDVEKPTVMQRLRVEDCATQLSYVLKFTTYHRPFTQRGSKKSPAVSLNPQNIAR